MRENLGVWKSSANVDLGGSYMGDLVCNILCGIICIVADSIALLSPSQ